MSDKDPQEETFAWEEQDDLTAISEERLRSLLGELAEEERIVSYRRRVLQGRIDLLRAELVSRGGASLSPRDLARVLMGETPVADKEPDAEPGSP